MFNEKWCNRAALITDMKLSERSLEGGEAGALVLSHH